MDLDPAAIAVAGDRSKRSAGLAQPTRDRPRHRELMLVGGAVLLYLWLLIRALGIEVTVSPCPTPPRRDLMAELRPEGPHRVTAADQALVDALSAGRPDGDTPGGQPVTAHC